MFSLSGVGVVSGALLASGLVLVSTASFADDVAGTPGPSVTGRVVNRAGDPLPGLTVTVQPLDTVPASGETGHPVLGRSTTDARGRWSVRLPTELPGAVEAAADYNGGVLNVTASVNGTFDGISFAAMRAMVVAVGRLAPGGRVIPARLAAYAQPPTTLVLASTVPSVSPAGAAAAARAVPADNWCFPWQFHTTKSHISWTSVASEHAYWDATGSVAYSKTASAGVGMELSVAGGGFQFSGYTEQANTISATLSVGALGPRVSRLFQIPIRYLWQRGVQRCRSGTEHGVRIVAAGWRVDPKTKNAYRWGGSVLAKDGHAEFRKSNPEFRTANKAHDGWTISSGRSVTIGAAASAFGVGIRAYTTWGHGHAQVWKAGAKRTRPHWTWCARSSILGKNPGVLYNW